MNVICLDFEGVVVPEIWIAFAERTGIPELRRTTRDEPDYRKLMKFRIELLRERGLGLREIQEVIQGMEPLAGAKEFLDELRTLAPVVVVSDTFEQFAAPLLQKLGNPTIFCQSLQIDENGMICGVNIRKNGTKQEAVRALQSIGYDTIAFGDSFNDLGMIRASKAGFLFRTTDAIRAANPDVPAFEDYHELISAIRQAL